MVRKANTKEPIKRKVKKSKRDKESSLVFNCTSCAQPQLLVQGKRNILCHPQLQVGVCRECLIFAHADIVPLDDDGYEIYCRWCSELGNLVCCDECKTPFCEECISRNVGPDYYNSLMDVDEWRCFICEPAAIEGLRELTKAALDHQNYNDPSDLLLEKCSAVFNGDADINDSDREEIVKERLRLRRNNLNETLSRKKKEKAAAVSDEEMSEASDEFVIEDDKSDSGKPLKKNKKSDSDSEYESSSETQKKSKDSDSDSASLKKESDNDSKAPKMVSDSDEDKVSSKKSKGSDNESLPEVSMSDSVDQKKSGNESAESNETLDLDKPTKKRKKKKAKADSTFSDSEPELLQEKPKNQKKKSYKLSLKKKNDSDHGSKSKDVKKTKKKRKLVSSDEESEEL